MRQSWYFRLLGLLMLPLYATGAWVAPALQVCPMHGSPAGAHGTMEMAGMPTGQPEHAAHTPSQTGVAHSSAPASHTLAATDAPATTHQHGCDCLGCCAGSNGPAVPYTQLALVAPTVRNHETFALKNAKAVVTRLAHVLPFATAPPRTLV